VKLGGRPSLFDGYRSAVPCHGGIDDLDTMLSRWDLTPDGEPVITPTSRLLPVARVGMPAMLKIAVLEEERTGNLVMNWCTARRAY
jgi:streptomycin 6-kinase